MKQRRFPVAYQAKFARSLSTLPSGKTDPGTLILLYARLHMPGGGVALYKLPGQIYIYGTTKH